MTDETRSALVPLRLQVRWITDVREMELLDGPWRSLEASASERTVFSSIDYVLPWYRHYTGILGEPMLGAVWRGRDLVAVAPLVRWNGTLGRIPVRRLDFTGHHWDAGELLIRDDAAGAVDCLVRALARLRGPDVTCINGLDPKSRLFTEVMRSVEAEGIRAVVTTYRYASVDLHSGYEAYCSEMSSNFRRNLKRHLERVQSAGPFRIERVLPETDAGSLDRTIDRMFAIANRSWKAAVSGPMAEHHRRFYRESIQRFHARGIVDLAILVVSGRDAAFLLGLVERGRYYDFTISYDDAFEPLSPGTFIMQQVMATLPDSGVDTVVSHGDHPYKERWATAFPSLTRLFLFAKGPRATLSRWARFSLPQLRPSWLGHGVRGTSSDRDRRAGAR